MRRKRILLSVINDLVTDQRVHRVATTLKNMGTDVTVIGRKLPESLPLDRGYRTLRMRLLFRKKVFFYAEYNIRLFFLLLFRKADILVANDLDTLPANYLVSVIRRKILVYDSHEYFTGMPEIQGRPVVYKVWKAIEKYIFPKLHHVYTVNQSIAQLYSKEYSQSVQVVRNMPLRIQKPDWPDRTTLDLPVDKYIALIQGAGINMHRGAEEAILAMTYLNDTVLLIIGGGDVLNELHRLVADRGIEDKILFRPKMPYEDLMAYTRLVDVGLSLDKDTNINYKYSLPNKLFDYIQAEIPVLCSDLVEVAGIVKSWNIGAVASNHDPVHLAQKIREMVLDRELRLLWKKNLVKAAKELCWEKEQQHLVQIYKNLL